ncbi:MAG TPA: efflux RND transporter periplasmic adaptor subunit [Pseudolabrys sp.]|jgi:multidrug efflux system membrane fusion protein|nr:efflux RND transporter periplasmic adaptor subunit [Pseudolabrys sp.]
MNRRLLALGAAFLIALAGELTWKIMHSAAAADRAVAQTSSNGRPVPATVGIAERRNVPVYLTGLGTVQAFNTVTVNTRVDGELNKVAFVEGQNVKAGDVLAQIDPRPFQASLALAQATKAKDEALLANARIDLQRFQKVPLGNTQQQIDTQAALVQQLVATVDADAANIDAAQVQLDYTTIKAPLSGRTGVRLVDQGNIVHATSTTGLVVITQLQPISVVFTLPQDQLQEVVSQMSATSPPLKVVALGRGDTQRLDEGTLALVDNQIDQTTGSVRLKATFPNKNYTLWPGQYVNAQLLLKTLPQVVTVPSAAIQRGPKGMYVYTVTPDSTVSMQPVDVSEMTNGTSVVDKGLDPGTKIVVAGQYRLEPGSRIRGTPAPRLASEK